MAPEPRPIDAQGHAERRLTAEHVAARALVESATFGEAAPRILEAICDALDWQYGALWRIDRDADLLRCVDTWCSPVAEFPEFDAVSRRITFRRGEGLPGRVWGLAQPAWIPDVVHDTNFPRQSIAAGFQSMAAMRLGTASGGRASVLARDGSRDASRAACLNF